jgi:hypothetical protein
LRGHPVVDLLEASFEAFFELLEIMSVFIFVGDIHEDADEVIPPV